MSQSSCRHGPASTQYLLDWNLRTANTSDDHGIWCIAQLFVKGVVSATDESGKQSPEFVLLQLTAALRQRGVQMHAHLLRFHYARNVRPIA